jgi:PTH1 family peptidyl-tRNA hydrolase
MWLFAGLGNPGDEHARDRHNVGFMALDQIADDYRFPAWKKKFSGLMAEGVIGGQKIILLKPLTYMNLSGQSVQAAAQFFKIDPSRIVVFHDELDIEAGKIRVKVGGGNAGHNGLRSIQEHLGTPDFKRVRMGIGHPGGQGRVTGYVLGAFSKADQEWLGPLLQAVSKHAALVCENDIEYMNKIAIDIKEKDE